MTSKYQKQEKPPSLVHTVTFLSKNTFIGLPPLKAYSRMEVYYRFKTKHTSGLFFYNGGKHNDFALAELINGHILINIRSGTHVIRLRDTSKNSYSDNYWHSVHLLQISATMFCLLIDDQVASTTTISRPHNIQLNGMFYVGEFDSLLICFDKSPMFKIVIYTENMRMIYKSVLNSIYIFFNMSL